MLPILQTFLRLHTSSLSFKERETEKGTKRTPKPKIHRAKSNRNKEKRGKKKKSEKERLNREKGVGQIYRKRRTKIWISKARRAMNADVSGYAYQASATDFCWLRYLSVALSLQLLVQDFLAWVKCYFKSSQSVCAGGSLGNPSQPLGLSTVKPLLQIWKSETNSFWRRGLGALPPTKQQ